MKVDSYHTTTPEDDPPHRNVYHNQSERSDGKRIKRENKVPGTVGRPRCDECLGIG